MSISDREKIYEINARDDEFAQEADFMSQLKSLGNSYDPTNSSWSTSRLEAFKNVLKQQIINKIPDSKVEYANITNRDEIQTVGKQFDLRITVISEKYGKLSTDLEIGMVMHKDCPHNLPQLIANEFKNELCKS